MAPLFLDSSFLIALIFKADQNHKAAHATWAKVTGERRLFITTTFILDEAVMFLNARGQHSLAVSIGNLLLASPSIEMLDIDRPAIERAWQYFVRHHDKSYSFTDCLSFSIMRERAVSLALTFDADFRQAGFEVAI